MVNKFVSVLEDLENDQTGNESLLEQFACPICFEYMDKKIYICVNGHSLCGGCNTKVSKCPVCKVKLNSRRNISLEQAAKKVIEWKSKQENGKASVILKGIGTLKRTTRFSLGSPLRTQPDDFLTENQIQCPHPKCCYFTKHLLQLKIHLQSWHPNQLYNIKKESGIQSEKVIRVRLYWDLNSVYDMFVLTASDTFFVVYLIKASNFMKSPSHFINVLTVSNKTKMFKFTCGNTSKFSMFYQGRHQAQDGIEVDSNTIETLNRAGCYKNYVQIYITRVAALHNEDQD